VRQLLQSERKLLQSERQLLQSERKLLQSERQLLQSEGLIGITSGSDRQNRRGDKKKLCFVEALAVRGDRVE